jgi:U3 small nucleolar RNA-associated protein 19
MASILSKKQKKNEKYTLKELKSLGHDLLTSRSHINNLPLLLTFVSPESPPQFVVESLLSLQSFFTPLLSQLPPTSSSPSSTKTEDPEVVFKAWLRSKFDEFVKLLLDVLVSQQSEDSLRGIVLGTLMEFVKLLNAGRFHSSIYHRLLDAIIHSEVDIEIFLDILTSKYFKYIDVRYFTYISMEKFVKTLEASVSADRTVIENNEAESDSKERLVSVNV